MFFWEGLGNLIEKFYMMALPINYLFEFHGHKVTLKSLSPREVHEDQILMKKKRENEKEKSSKHTLLISRHEVQREIVAHNPIFLAIPRPLKLEPLEDSPHCLDNLVKEFHDVFQDPPKGLPPLRAVSYTHLTLPTNREV